MRENMGLYRGKRKDNGEWIKGAYVPENRAIISYFEIGNYDPCCDEMNCKDVVHKVFPETVGEYTGLTDKNKVMIFEGDIIKLKDYHGLRTVYIFWETRGAWFYGGDGYSDEYIFNSSKREVIGNIHDNPELLNGDEV